MNSLKKLTDMKDIIVNKLKEIEFNEGIQMLFACETGSRAWGFPSPDSDYDARFIYKHDLDWYLSLKDRKDSIQIPIEGDLDITGWELKKCMSLMYKSNCALFERLQSRIIYMSKDGFADIMMGLASKCFSAKAAMHHYHSMSLKYVEQCMKHNNVKLKSYFYAIRTTMAASWIRIKGSVAPIYMPDMYAVVDAQIVTAIEELIHLKSKKNESYMHVRNNVIDEYLQDQIQTNENIKDQLSVGKRNVSLLDEFFISEIKSAGLKA